MEGKIIGRIKVTGRWGRKRRELLDGLKERREYSHLKEEALDRTVWRAVMRQTTIWINEYNVYTPKCLHASPTCIWLLYLNTCRGNVLHVSQGCALSHYVNSYKDQLYISACISSMNMVLFHEHLYTPIFCWFLQHSYIFETSDVKINECIDWDKNQQTRWIVDICYVLLKLRPINMDLEK
jgi:hypothetical protein